MERKKGSLPVWAWVVIGLAGLSVVIVVGLVIMGGLLGTSTLRQYESARQERSEVQAGLVRTAAMMWTLKHPGECPSASDLVEDGQLQPGAATSDAWGGPFGIECASGEITVRSAGPDGSLGTSDDILTER